MKKNGEIQSEKNNNLKSVLESVFFVYFRFAFNYCTIYSMHKVFSVDFLSFLFVIHES